MIRVTNYNFTSDLNNRRSGIFLIASKAFVDKFRPMIRRSIPGAQDVVVQSISKGLTQGVVVSYHVVMNQTVSINTTIIKHEIGNAVARENFTTFTVDKSLTSVVTGWFSLFACPIFVRFSYRREWYTCFQFQKPRLSLSQKSSFIISSIAIMQ